MFFLKSLLSIASSTYVRLDCPIDTRTVIRLPLQATSLLRHSNKALTSTIVRIECDSYPFIAKDQCIYHFRKDLVPTWILQSSTGLTASHVWKCIFVTKGFTPDPRRFNVTKEIRSDACPDPDYLNSVISIYTFEMFVSCDRKNIFTSVVIMQHSLGGYKSNKI